MESSLFADFSSLSSPLEQVFGHVPKGHDKALRQVKLANLRKVSLYEYICSDDFCYLLRNF